MPTCPYYENYKFSECCNQKCKNWTDKTKTKCLSIDRKPPDGIKFISDTEICYYKNGSSVRTTQYQRKQALERIIAILILKDFISYLDMNYTEKRDLSYKSDLDNVFPFNEKSLNWKPYLRPLLKEREFTKYKKHKMGKVLSFTLYHIIDILTNFKDNKNG